MTRITNRRVSAARAAGRRPFLSGVDTAWTALLLTLLTSGAADASDRTLNLPLGDSARKQREIAIVLDGVTDTAANETVTADLLAARLADVRLLLIGETHTAMEFHRVQARAIELLHKAGRRVSIGLEMFPYTEQRWLDAWTDGLLTERGFVELSRWYEHWSYPWEYYREIFLFARDRRIPMVAVNTPREVVTAVRKKGFANLTPDEAAHVPAEIDVDSADHLALFKASFEPGDPLHGGMTEEAWKGMFSAQVTWDATMGFNAVRALDRIEDRSAIMVVLVGSGHVAYGLGIERQAKRWFAGQVASLIPVPVANEPGRPVNTVRASYANFVWGVPAETGPMYPALGLSTRALEGDRLRQVIQVEKGSIAQQSGFLEGDVLLSMDGQPIADRETFHRLMAGARWGDAAAFLVRRGPTSVPIRVRFQRAAPAGSPRS